MKRIAAVLLALLLFSAACGDDTDSVSVSEGAPSEQADEPNAESSAEVAPEGDDDTVLEGEQGHFNNNDHHCEPGRGDGC